MPSAAFPGSGLLQTIIPLGVDSKAYRTDAAAYDKLCKNISGAAIKNSKAGVKITRKGAGRKTETIAGIEVQTVDFILRDVRLDEADSQEVFAFAAAYDLNTPIDLLFLDGEKTTEGAMGWGGFWRITKFDRNEDDENDTHYACTVEPASGTAKPVRMVYVASGGALTDHTAEEPEEP